MKEPTRHSHLDHTSLEEINAKRQLIQRIKVPFIQPRTTTSKNSTKPTDKSMVSLLPDLTNALPPKVSSIPHNSKPLWNKISQQK